MDRDVVIASPDRVAIGDLVSLRDVFDASYRRLVVQLFCVVGNYGESEDIVQEAFVRAAAAGARFLRVDNHEAWLRTVAVNIHRNRWRKWRNNLKANDRIGHREEPVELAEHVDVVRALRALPDDLREVVALYYLADLPVREIAESLSIKEGTVKSRLSRARQMLSVTLAEGVKGDE
jgi:RNA polymerase sigma-70 factor (ECF subfamily)